VQSVWRLRDLATETERKKVSRTVVVVPNVPPFYLLGVPMIIAMISVQRV